MRLLTNRPVTGSADRATKSSAGTSSDGKASADKASAGNGVARGPKAARRVLGLLVLLAACWGILLAARPTPPSGDPVLVSSSPGDSEIVRSPDEVRLTFDQPVPAELATVRMTKPSGEQVVAGRPYNPRGASNTIAVRMPSTRYAGTYSVAWALPSSRLAPISGRFRFAVYQPTEPVREPAVVTERDAAVVTFHTMARLVAMAGFALGVGVLFVLATLWPAGSRHGATCRLVVGAWCALVVGSVGTIASFGGHAARTSLGEAFDPALLSGTLGSDIGAALVARLLVLVPITVVLVRLGNGSRAQSAQPRKATAKAAATEARPGRWWAGGAVLGCAAALAVTWSLARPHAPDEPTLLMLGAETLLLLALATSVGGLAVLWMLLRGADDSVLRTVVPRLGRVMPVCGGLLAISAAAASGWQTVVLIGLAVLVAGTGVAARGWVRRSRHADVKALPSRVALRRVAAVATCAGVLALVATSMTGPGDANLALGRGPVDGDQGHAHTGPADVW